MTIRSGDESRISALVIVAHPDDETIWCGGLILQNPHWSWSVFSLCRAEDPDRAPKFHRVCEALRAEPLISDLDDSGPLKPIDPARDIGGRIRERVEEKDWGLVLTHGGNGEYGHPRHREIHGEVVRLAAAGIVRCRELWTFAYVRDARGGHCLARRDASVRLPLTEEQLAEKKRIVHEIYGYSKDSFEVRACVSPEGYRRRIGPEQGASS